MKTQKWCKNVYGPVLLQFSIKHFTFFIDKHVSWDSILQRFTSFGRKLRDSQQDVKPPIILKKIILKPIILKISLFFFMIILVCIISLYIGCHWLKLQSVLRHKIRILNCIRIQDRKRHLNTLGPYVFWIFKQPLMPLFSNSVMPQILIYSNQNQKFRILQY